MILCLETSTELCSVALCTVSGVTAVKESREEKSHATRLTIIIEELLSSAGIRVTDLEAVAVSKGPGSYTGLRIGVSVAKGITYAASIPLIGVDTTLSMFYGITEEMRKRYGTDETTLFIPMLDARRMEVYYSVMTSEGKIVKEVSAEVINEGSFSDIPEQGGILLFGNGAEKCMQIINRPDKQYAEEFSISAAHMYYPAYKALSERRFEDIAYFEPFYLKDFITSRPKKNILGR